MDLLDFLKEGLPDFEEREVVLSARFKKGGEALPFKLKGISEAENAAIRRRFIKGEGPGAGFDTQGYQLALAAACVKSPDLEDASLQAAFGVMGAERLLAAMLSAGEFALLLQNARDLCGFDHTIREMADDVKNGSGRAAAPSGDTPAPPCGNSASARGSLPG